MAKKTNPMSEQPEGGLTLRRCIGSTRFGIEPHDAAVEDFPAQPSQKDGLGRMCKPHWRQYTAGLAHEAKARKAGTEPEPPASVEPDAEQPKRSRKRDVVLAPLEAEIAIE